MLLHCRMRSLCLYAADRPGETETLLLFLSRLDNAFPFLWDEERDLGAHQRNI